MDINDYKAALKQIIDATNDEAILKHWKTHLEREYEQYQQQGLDQSKTSSGNLSGANTSDDKDDTSGYVILESGLGIDE